MKNINILIVEDESIVAMEIENYIDKLNYNIVGICKSFEEVMNTIRNQEINIALLDIHIIGDKDGIDVAVEMKKMYPDIEIIFLTAHTDSYNVDRAIELNPIAYLSKPFKRDELQIFFKIAAKKILDKSQTPTKESNRIILDDDFQYDLATKALFFCDEQVRVTKKELLFLEVLLENRNKVVSIETITDHIWPEMEVNVATIRNLVKRLRQKLNHKFIKTSSSMGYMIVSQN